MIRAGQLANWRRQYSLAARQGQAAGAVAEVPASCVDMLEPGCVQGVKGNEEPKG